MPHYFDDRPGVRSAPQTIEVVLPGLAFTLETDHGVFSHGHVDTGTALLLREAPTPAAFGNLLDLGCGAGVLSIALALRSPKATVWAVDTNTRARQLTTANARRNRVANLQVVAPDEVPDEVRFDTIWSNPPIRIGKQALHALLLHWLSRLTERGEATLVVQKHLGADSLQRWLIEQGYPTERIASRSAFRLLATRSWCQT